ncbi:MAG: GNAT family N-acetyltransferase [Bacteroidetes bacterium]|nr:GNAT family N-acetyltransferase [Bacteroidota bacterium]
MNIRKVKESDCNQLIDLLNDIGWFSEILSRPKDLLKDKFLRDIGFCLKDDSHSLYVVEGPDNNILGYASVHWLPYLFLDGPEGYISELFIRREERGKGIGRKLLETIKEDAKRRGCSRLSLLNGRNRESYERNFYQKQGFIERDQMANFICKLK